MTHSPTQQNPEMRVLIVSTSLGAGHNGAATVLAHLLEDAGHTAHIVDYLDLLAFHSGSAVQRYYSWQLKFAPWTYEKAYSHFERVHGPFARLNAHFSERSLLRAAHELGANVIVSNNPHATMALGQLRRTGKLSIPVVNSITDFGVHALWVHPDVDANLVLHEEPARQARARDAQRVTVVKPLVDPAFGTFSRDPELRSAWGVADDDIAVLVTAGSWGIGSLVHTTRELARIDHIVPIVVCGNDTATQHRLRRRTNAKVFGWVGNMAEIMGSVDVLVENAGGLTSIEALSSQVPVVSYRSIVGHGRHNARALEAAGLTRYARTHEELSRCLNTASAVPHPFGGTDAVAAIEAFHAMQ